jgi:hypothetical protein
MAKQRVGGSFAPPLSDELLAKYERIALDASGPVGDALLSLLICVKTWWELPFSGPEGSEPHPSGTGTIVPLDAPIATALYDHIPWDHELKGIQELFDGIPVEKKELRNAAFHLLWHVKELNMDREPITSDLIKP